MPGLPVDLGRAGGGETLGETETAEDGTYSFTVDPGTYEVRLRLPERFALLGPSNPQSVSVEGGATGSADFRLRLRAGAVVGTVADTTGAALAGITAALRLSSGGELTTETDGSGAFRFDRASIGVQSLFISITDGA
ncbi:MAG: carboxypeptidase regulatory-like domain-containing protein, partial [Actinobacteria bacterium]|nr:carboxypeptidase regulatory-like domain-containing protein [Actinomycetota bacterium]